MKPITREMIKVYGIKGFDFMGYTIDRENQLSFHHLIIPHRESRAYGIGEGYLMWNGAILRQNTSHDYLHLIERYDPEVFLRITSEMIDENIKGKLDVENLRKIRDLLLYFEREYGNKTKKDGRALIKREYIEKRIKV